MFKGKELFVSLWCLGNGKRQLVIEEQRTGLTDADNPYEDVHEVVVHIRDQKYIFSMKPPNEKGVIHMRNEREREAFDKAFPHVTNLEEAMEKADKFVDEGNVDTTEVQSAEPGSDVHIVM